MIKCRLKILLAEKALRDEKRSYTMREVAAATGLSKDTVTDWANNNVKRFDEPVLDKLCKFLGCQVGDLLIRVPEDDVEV